MRYLQNIKQDRKKHQELCNQEDSKKISQQFCVSKRYITGDDFFHFYCDSNTIRVKRQTFNSYLVDWKKKWLIYPAGRGWYSDIPDEFALYTEPLTELNAFLAKTFPLLECVCWSTRQLTSYYHNLPGKFFTFVYVDRYSMREVAEALRNEYPNDAVLINPGKREIKDFSPQNHNYVIRPIIYDDRRFAVEPCLHIENILVDLAMESETLSLMDESEYSNIINNVASSGRIKPGVIARRLTRRKAKNGYCDILRRYFQMGQKSTNVNSRKKVTLIDDMRGSMKK